MADFTAAVQYVLGNEGASFTHDYADNGGATKFGITQLVLGQYRQAQVSSDDVNSLTEQEARDIYQKLYWDFMSLSQIRNQSVATLMLDMAVNLGQPTAARLLQRSLGLKSDGVLGPKTIERANDQRPADLLRELQYSWQSYYIEIVLAHPQQIRYLQGWLRRSLGITQFVAEEARNEQGVSNVPA